MNCIIYPGNIRGKVSAPSSKSYAQRAIIAASLTAGTSRLSNIGFSDDVLYACHNAINLGAEIRHYNDVLEITGGGNIRSSNFHAGESGLSARMLSALLIIIQGERTLSGSGSLLKRPFDPILQVYDQLKLSYHTKNNFLPITLNGSPQFGDIQTDGTLSSQFITGLLCVLPLANFKHKLHINNKTSGAYIQMTLDLLKRFGIEWISETDHIFSLGDHRKYIANDYTIEGDWSGASFLIAAALIDGAIQIENLQEDSLQADRAISSIPGSKISLIDDTCQVNKTNIKAFTFNASDCPDLFPPLASIAAFANGPCKIKGVHRLRHKESDRAKVLQKEFAKLWVRIDIEGDDMIIHPSRPTMGEADANNDHRIAMALAVLGMNAEGPVRIKGVECISKSYPDFFKDLNKLGVKIDFE